MLRFCFGAMEHAWIVVARQRSSVKPSTGTHERVTWGLPEPFSIYNQGDASLKLWLTRGTVLCSRFSSKDQSLENKGMWDREGDQTMWSLNLVSASL